MIAGLTMEGVSDLLRVLSRVLWALPGCVVL
jgi:hypothetical protein